MPDWQLWSLESLFNRRKSTAREMAKQTSFPSPAPQPHQRQEGGKRSGLSFPAGYSSVLKHPEWAATSLRGLQDEKPPEALIKQVRVCKAPGKTSLHFGKAFLSSSLWKVDFFSRQTSLEKTGLFHVSWFGFVFLLTFLLTSIININASMII